MLKRNDAGPETVESVRRGEGSLGWKWFVEQEGFELGVKQRRSRLMDNDSGESTEEDEVAGVGRDESEFEWLVRGCRREAGS